MEDRYPELAAVIKSTQTSDSFHLAEENKQDIPDDDVRDLSFHCKCML